MDRYLAFAIIVFVAWIVIGLIWISGLKKTEILKRSDKERYKNKEYPLVSVIIPACNEERAVEHCLESIVKQDYKNFEIIVINDRSTDTTGLIVERLKEKHPQIKSIHIKELPEGWLGKNHALYTGVMEARGEWLLFTDADIIHSQESLEVGLGYARKNKLDHLSIVPDTICTGLFEKIFIAYFAFVGLIFVTMQKYGGIGAFNLIKKSTYLDIGTHKAIALCPVDDMKLGKLIVMNKYKQQVVWGRELLRVKWQDGFISTIKGLEKNSFPSLNYSLWNVIILIFSSLLIHVYPFIGILIGGLVSRILCGVVILIISTLYGSYKKFSGVRLWYVIFHPIISLIMLFALFNSTFKTIFRRGIEWRGTKYSLDLLKTHRY
ncbi:MAG: glycosyltransferase family 2 protein [Desulfitobacteriaceae bacterium]